MYKCDCCGKTFRQTIWEDNGYGDTYYGDSYSYHIDLEEVSPCCHESFQTIDDEELDDL